MTTEPASGGFPASVTSTTLLLVASDLERSRRWYRDVLGADETGSYEGSAVFRLAGQWLLVVEGGGPTADKPTVTFASPVDQDRVDAELILAVPDCQAAYAELLARGAEFLTPPVTYAWEVRAFFRDPDGHLFEITERRR